MCWSFISFQINYFCSELGGTEKPGSPFIDVEAISSDEDEESNVIGQNVAKSKGGKPFQNSLQ